MVVITERSDGNWTIVFDWAIPEVLQIEDGEIQTLRDELVRLFGPGPINGG